MRTSHKLTHTRSRQFWLRLLSVTLLLGGLVLAGARLGGWTARADGLQEAKTRLDQAKAAYLAKATTENRATFDKALNTYKAALAANPAPAAPVQNEPYSAAAYGFVETRPLTELLATPAPNANGKGVKPIKGEMNEIPFRPHFSGPTDTSDPVRQSSITPGQNLVTAPIQNFDGPDMDAGAVLFGGRFAPNDPNADVGPNHVVVTTNGGMRIFDKAGAPLTAVFRMSVLTPGIPAAVDDDGDPIVLYDPLADRWVVTQFGLTLTNNSTHEIIAISKTGDPTGAYFVYDFLLTPGRAGDYPHLGVWPDGYYMSTNDFNTSFTAFLGAGFYAFERAKMLAGDPTAKIIGFNTPGPTDGGMLPADLDGVLTPPVGTPNLFFEFFADEFGPPGDVLRVFEFRPNYATPASSTLTQRPDIAMVSFDANAPASRAVIDQPPPAVAADSLDGISDRFMHRAGYRTLTGGVQSFVLNFTVNVSGVTPTNNATFQGGVRWMELRRDGGTGTITFNQQATYAPGAISGATGRNLWMASVAQDGEGNIGLAASASSTTLIPTAIYTGRLAGDALNTLTQGEVDAMAAVTRGVQTGTGNRWGDYSSLSVDPADECTFWGAFEYADAPTASFDWNTRVFSFKVNPTCVSPAKGSIQGTATNTSLGGAPLAGVRVSTDVGHLRVTNNTGTYSFTSAAPNAIGGVAPGTYTVTCRKDGFNTVSGSVTVTAGGTATFNCALTGTPTINLASSTITAEDCNTDGRADPGENLSVSVCLNNTGGANTANLVATLAATGGVTNPSAPQSYGVVTAGGAAVCRTFSFRVNPAQACGANVVASFTLADGASNLGAFTITFGSGTPIITFTENFDGVTAPALPAGWTTATSGAPLPVWVNSTTTPDTAPNDIFSPDVATGVTGVGQVNEIVSPSIPISSASAQLQFRNLFNMESTFDGGVLEIKIGAGAFTDIVTAGGTFVSGGYTGTLSSSFGNPLGGRMAWTGLSGGTTAAPVYVTTLINLPAAANGQNIQLRFRTGIDDSVVAAGANGWRIDTIQVLGGVQCCAKITPTVSLTDPLSCTGPGDTVNGSIALVNPTASAITGTITTALPGGLVAVPGACTANVGTCTVVNASTITWTGTLAGNATLNISYQAQIGDQVLPGTQVCATTTGSFGGVGVTSVQACLTINCQAVGPGSLPGTAGTQVSDQRAGSVLIYNVYTSAAGSSSQNTRISITNVEPNRSAFVHLFFVDGTSCSVADAFICLTPQQTTSFLASDLDPGTTGYLVAIASDRNGCPINFNYLIGDEYVKFATGHQANLAAEAVQAIAGGLTACTPGSTTATVRFDGVSYGLLPRVLAVDNVGSRGDGNDTLLVLNAIGGDLRSNASTLRPLFGILYDDAEKGVSFTFAPGTCQFRSAVNNTFPKITPRFTDFVPAGRTAWFKFWIPTDNTPILGSMINFNPNAAANAGAFNQGHNLHKLTFTSSGSYLIPVLPVTCQ